MDSDNQASTGSIGRFTGLLSASLERVKSGSKRPSLNAIFGGAGAAAAPSPRGEPRKQATVSLQKKLHIT